MKFTTLIPSAALLLQATGSLAQNAAKFTDSVTGISFTGYGSSKGYRFGVALPDSPKSDVIVQISGPVAKEGGWAGMGFGASMIGPMLLATYANGDKIVVSPRVAKSYSAASVYTANAIKITPIAKGSFKNDTHVTATFVCGGCINKDTFDASKADAVFNYAYSTTKLSSTADNAPLNDHTANGEDYGQVQVTLKDAKSADYDKWASGGSGSGSSSVAGSATATSAPATSAAASSAVATSAPAATSSAAGVTTTAAASTTLATKASSVVASASPTATKKSSCKAKRHVMRRKY